MNPERHLTRHLSEDEFAECLLGLADPAVQAHAAGCPLCRQEMENFGASVASFNQASLAWSREKTREQTESRNANHSHRFKPGRNAQPVRRVWAMSFAAAAAILLAIAIPLKVMHTRQQASLQNSAVTASVQTAAATDDAAEIADDNQMLASINAEISQPVASPMESFAPYHSHTLEHQDRSAHEDTLASRRRSDAL